ncbi:MAG: S-layer homology domain-containing protein, partial [Syntrophomonas sp.]
MKRRKRGLLFAALILLMIMSLAAAAAAAEQPTGTNTVKAEPVKNLFNDVKSTDHNALFINYLADLKIISGYPDGSYKAQEGLTRAQAAVILGKAAGLQTPAVSSSSFPDVKSDHWAAPSIAAAAKAGYLKGYPDGSFKPEEKLTRAQGIALVMRLSKQEKRDELPALKDMPKNHWAAADMATALNAGMIGLSQDKTQVNPEAIMTRGSLAGALGTLLTKDPGLYGKTLTGTIKDIKGEIKLTRNGSTTTLQNGAPISKGDTITAGANSTANLVYPDGSSVLIEEITELYIKESLGRACIKENGTSGIAVDNVDIELKKGTLFGALATKHENTPEKPQAQNGETLLASMNGLGYLADNQTPPWYQQAEAKKVKMKVDMPYGVAAIRGTYLLVTVTQDANGNITGCDVVCLTGDATVQGNNDQTGQSLTGGTSTSINNGGNAA